MIVKKLDVPTYSKWMYLDGYTPQEIFASGKQHFYELATLREEVPKAIDNIIEEALDQVLSKLNN